jgi:hypothetical protein
MNPALDAVLPVIEPDLARTRLLARSVERFFPELEVCWAVTPRESVAAVRAALPGRPYRVLPEDEVVPELARPKEFDRIAALVGPRGGIVPGWYRQQLVKLAAADIVGSDFYLTLDADVICTRPTTAADLVRRGRGICDGRRLGRHPDWHEWVERVLGIESRQTEHGVTPAVLSRDCVHALARHLEERSEAAGRPDTWRGYLMRSTPWTEYALYTTYLEHAGLYDRYHLRVGSGAMYGNCVWSSEQYAGWDPAASFDPDARFRFSVVQSTAGVPAEELAVRLQPFLSAAPVPT